MRWKKLCSRRNEIEKKVVEEEGKKLKLIFHLSLGFGEIHRKQVTALKFHYIFINNVNVVALRSHPALHRISGGRLKSHSLRPFPSSFFSAAAD
jgi:hypothetical protein